MIEFLSNLDTQIFLTINRFNTPALDQFMMLLSHKLVWIPLYAAILTLLIHRFGWKVGIALALGAALAVTISDQVCATWIRPYVERMRPANLDNPLSTLVHTVNDYRGGSYGFPSCHAANTFAFATFMSLVFRMRRPIVVTLLVWAILNCWSRIYLGVHYPGDLLVGAMIGLLSGLCVYKVQSFLLVKTFRVGQPRPASGSLRISGTPFSPELKLDMLLVAGYVGALTIAVALGVSIVSYLF